MSENLEKDKNFWNTTPLDMLSEEEWESLCDGCGKCCLHKLQDEDTQNLFYTNVACRLLDINSAHCQNYSKRLEVVAGCLDIKKLSKTQREWLPATCAYRLRGEGKALPSWHPLFNSDAKSASEDVHGILSKAVSEDSVNLADLEYHLIPWVEV